MAPEEQVPESLYQTPKDLGVASGETDSEERAYSSGFYYAASPFKYIIWSFFTLGFWRLVWAYRNFKKWAENEEDDFSPVARTLFLVFFIYPLFHRIERTAKKREITNILPLRICAVYWIIFILVVRLTHPGLWIVALDFILLIPANSAAVKINKSFDPDYKPDSKFSAWSVLLLLLFGTLSLLHIAAQVLPSFGVAPFLSFENPNL